MDELPDATLIEIDGVVRGSIEDSIWRYLVVNGYLVERGTKDKTSRNI